MKRGKDAKNFLAVDYPGETNIEVVVKLCMLAEKSVNHLCSLQNMALKTPFRRYGKNYLTYSAVVKRNLIETRSVP